MLIIYLILTHTHTHTHTEDGHFTDYSAHASTPSTILYFQLVLRTHARHGKFAFGKTDLVLS